MSIEQIDQKFEASVSEIKNLWAQALEELHDLKDKSDEKMQKLKDERDQLEKKYTEAQNKIDHIENQLSDKIEQLESITKTKAKGIDAMQLLDVYIVLMEQVFESQAHTRLLIMLHGDKDVFTLQDLTKAAGIGAIDVRQAVFELRNAGVVEYNDETQEVKLLMRFME